jgi:hypothetical protein
MKFLLLFLLLFWAGKHWERSQQQGKKEKYKTGNFLLKATTTPLTRGLHLA